MRMTPLPQPRQKYCPSPALCCHHYFFYYYSRYYYRYSHHCHHDGRPHAQ